MELTWRRYWVQSLPDGRAVYFSVVLPSGTRVYRCDHWTDVLNADRVLSQQLYAGKADWIEGFATLDLLLVALGEPQMAPSAQMNALGSDGENADALAGSLPVREPQMDTNEH